LAPNNVGVVDGNDGAITPALVEAVIGKQRGFEGEVLQKGDLAEDTSYRPVFLVKGRILP
jgi:hypothetical protein